MTRPTSPQMLAASGSPVAMPFVAAELLYPDGPVRLTSLPHKVEFGGHVWYGSGAMGAASAMEEGSENRSYGFTLTLSGIPGNWSAYLRGQDVQGCLATMYLGFVDATHRVLATDVITVGRMDTQDVRAGAETSVTVSVEGINVDWERARVRRCTDVDHQARHPGDRFFEYTAALENMTLAWGR